MTPREQVRDQVPDLVSTEEAAKRIGVNYQYLWSLVRRGHLEPPKLVVGRSLCWSPADLARARKVIKGLFDKAKAQLQARSEAIFKKKKK
jgi:hypothetical protein